MQTEQTKPARKKGRPKKSDNYASENDLCKRMQVLSNYAYDFDECKDLVNLFERATKELLSEDKSVQLEGFMKITAERTTAYNPQNRSAGKQPAIICKVVLTAQFKRLLSKIMLNKGEDSAE